VGSWLRIGLGARYAVAMVAFDPAAGAAVTGYEIHVADVRGPDSGTISPTGARNHWGQPVAAGKWNPESGEPAPRVVLPTPKPGRFIVLHAASAAEIWMPLEPLAP